MLGMWPRNAPGGPSHPVASWEGMRAISWRGRVECWSEERTGLMGLQASTKPQHGFFPPKFTRECGTTTMLCFPITAAELFDDRQSSDASIW